MNPSPPLLPNEKELFERMARGDESAFSVIFLHYTARIQPFIFSLTRSESAAEEIVQEVFLNIWLNRTKMTEVNNYQAYIYTASNNRVYTWLKKRARELRLYAEAGANLPETEDGPETAIDLKESMAIIEQAVEDLPAQKKLIWRLSRREGLSHDQIAEQLGISKNTVKNHMVEALRMVREHLQERGGGAFALAGILLQIYRK
jgi:RNA polymerase sigma-70 factor (family 1)